MRSIWYSVHGDFQKCNELITGLSLSLLLREYFSFFFLLSPNLSVLPDHLADLFAIGDDAHLSFFLDSIAIKAFIQSCNEVLGIATQHH